MFIIFIASFYAYSGVHIEQMDGWIVTPVHDSSYALQKREHDRVVFCPHETKEGRHKSVSCWIREKQEGGYHLCAVKNGLFFEYNLLGDTKNWHHLPETVGYLRDFARNGGEKMFRDYWQDRVGEAKRQAIANACMAAIRDLQHEKMEPDAGGWNFVFKHNQELCRYYNGDIGGNVLWPCNGPVLFLEALKDYSDDVALRNYRGKDAHQHHYENTMWVRCCGDQKYVYVNMQGGIAIYNLSRDNKHLQTKSGKLFFLKPLMQEGFQWKSYDDVQYFKKCVRKFIYELTGGVRGGHFNYDLLQKGLTFPNHQPDGWSVAPVKPGTSCLKKRTNDLTILGSTDSAGSFQDRAVWLRKGVDQETFLCSWYQGVFFKYNVFRDKGWKHLPETRKFLRDFSGMIDSVGLEEAERFLSDDGDIDVMRFKNACFAAVRDCLWSPIETLSGCALFDPRDDVCVQSAGDVVLSLKGCVKGARWYGDGAIWVHLCGNASFLRAVIDGRLFQCRIDGEESASCWDGFADTLEALKMICVFGDNECLTFSERIQLRNSCKRLICQSLYKADIRDLDDGGWTILDGGWTIEKPHKLLLFEDTEFDHVLRRGLTAFEEKYDGAISWRFDGQEFLCVRWSDILLRYNLSSNKCNPRYQPSVECLKRASKKFFGLSEGYGINLELDAANELVHMGESVLESVIKVRATVDSLAEEYAFLKQL